MFDLLGLPLDVLDKVFDNLEDELKQLEKDISTMEKYISVIERNKADIISFMNFERKVAYYYSGHVHYLQQMDEDEVYNMIDIVSETLDNLRIDYRYEKAYIRSLFEDSHDINNVDMLDYW